MLHTIGGKGLNDLQYFTLHGNCYIFNTVRHTNAQKGDALDVLKEPAVFLRIFEHLAHRTLYTRD